MKLLLTLALLIVSGTRVLAADTLEEIRKKAELGDPNAQSHLGAIYLLGIEAPKDLAEAQKWLLKAAEQGDAVAEFSLGDRYVCGDSVPKDIAKAAEWYLRSADRGNGAAQYNMGVMYEHGWGVTQDMPGAVKWYRLTVDKGHFKAKYALGTLLHGGKGAPQDFVSARKLFTEVAFDQPSLLDLDKDTRRDAAFALAVMIDRGEGGPKNDKEATHWFLKAAELGHRRSKVEAARRYSKGIGIDRDMQEALKWYRAAAVEGEVAAAFILANRYHRGEGGIPQDYVEAHKWYNLLLAMNVREAKSFLSTISGEMTGAQIAEAQRRASDEWGKMSESVRSDMPELSLKDMLKRHPFPSEFPSNSHLTVIGCHGVSTGQPSTGR